ncbi:MAG: hypothetical protein GPJ54_16385 [Candidatus Heimdallarchaeota archaeon]|nr:hypothetical protein [Candidatus Heimdallarchaeota archaeon]
MQQQAIVIGLLGIIIVAGVSYSIWTNQDENQDFGFQDYGAAPNFTLDNMDGDSVTFDDHAGKTRVLTFIYTKCTAGCSTITVRMLNTLFSLNEQNMQDDIEFFVIDFDYMHDNSTDLQHYAHTLVGENAVPDNIEFLLGPEPAINKTATDWNFFYQIDSSPLMMDMNDTMDMTNTTTTDMEMTTTTSTDMDMTSTTTDMDDTHAGHEVVWIHPFVVYVIDENGEIRNKLWGLDWEQQFLEDMIKELA